MTTSSSSAVALSRVAPTDAQLAYIKSLRCMARSPFVRWLEWMETRDA